MKLALVSFDGLDPRVIYNNEDLLPNLHSFMQESIHGKWRTLGHTIPSYIATLTGLQYNEYDFYWDVTNGGFGRHRQTNYDFLWDLTDTSMTLLNIPVIYPPEDINGIMVSGMLAPDSVADTNLARPQEVQDMLNNINYIHEVRSDEEYDELGSDRFLEKLKVMMDKRYEATKMLVEEYNTDLFYGVWTATDRWFHKCFMEDELYGEQNYLELYEKSDEIAGKLLDLFPDDIPVVMFSDHGFRHRRTEEGVHKGHKYEGWYSIRHNELPSFRDDSASIFDLFPSTLNYFGEEPPNYAKGRILFHSDDQDEEVKDRLRDLGYME